MKIVNFLAVVFASGGTLMAANYSLAAEVVGSASALGILDVKLGDDESTAESKLRKVLPGVVGERRNYQGSLGKEYAVGAEYKSGPRPIANSKNLTEDIVRLGLSGTPEIRVFAVHHAARVIPPNGDDYDVDRLPDLNAVEAYLTKTYGTPAHRTTRIPSWSTGDGRAGSVTLYWAEGSKYDSGELYKCMETRSGRSVLKYMIDGRVSRFEWSPGCGKVLEVYIGTLDGRHVTSVEGLLLDGQAYADSFGALNREIQAVNREKESARGPSAHEVRLASDARISKFPSIDGTVIAKIFKKFPFDGTADTYFPKVAVSVVESKGYDCWLAKARLWKSEKIYEDVEPFGVCGLMDKEQRNYAMRSRFYKEFVSQVAQPNSGNVRSLGPRAPMKAAPNIINPWEAHFILKIIDATDWQSGAPTNLWLVGIDDLSR